MGKNQFALNHFLKEKVEGSRTGPRSKSEEKISLIFFSKFQLIVWCTVHTLDQIFQISKMITFVYQMAYYVMQDLRISSNI